METRTAESGARPGPGGPEEARTAIDLFRRRVQASGPAIALRFKEGGGWRTVTWTAWEEASREIAGGLCALGLAPGDRVGLLASTRHEWMLVELGILMAGCVTVPIYPSNTPEQVEYLLADSGARVVVAEDPHQLEKLLLPEIRAQLGAVRRVILVAEVASFEVPDAKSRISLRIDELLPPGHRDRRWVETLGGLRAEGARWLAEHPGALEERARAVGPESVFSIVYTSGTSGPPKGVVLTHANLCVECQALNSIMPITVEDEQMLFLPLAHILGRVLAWGAIALGGRTAFAESPSRLMENLREVRPTYFGSVPRVFEKAYLTIDRILADRRRGPFTRAALDRALEVGRRASRARQEGRRPDRLLAAEARLAERLVFRRIHEAFGGRIRFFISGGAPLAQEVAEFFHATGLLILEGYGLTETTAATHVNRPGAYRFGTVGPPIPGVEVQVAPDGEILLRGGTVFREYWRNEGATREAKDDHGWLHTGDIGRIEPGGFLRITDRKKDILVTAGGKNVAPQNLENALQALCPYVSHVAVIGDRRPFLVALVTLNEETVGAWARAQGIAFQDGADLSVRLEVRGLIQQAVNRLNERLAGFEEIRRFAILPRDFSQEAGELTPTGKIRRKETAERHRGVIERLYGAR